MSPMIIVVFSSVAQVAQVAQVMVVIFLELHIYWFVCSLMSSLSLKSRILSSGYS